MITVPTQAESLDSAQPDSPAGPASCLRAQRALVQAAKQLIQRMPLAAADATDLLRLGLACVHFAAERAFMTHYEQEAVRAWKECELGERQIRRATFRALRAGDIQNQDYDELFRIANQAKRSRERELTRLRQRLHQLAVI
jgi:hypothetical protein